MNEKNFSKPLDLKSVRITDAFWGREQELVRTEVIPYQWEALNDRVPGADPSFCMRNFKTAGRLVKKAREDRSFVPPAYTFRGFNVLPEEGKEPEEDRFYGFVFQDSDFYKWIEAVAYSLTAHPDPELERIADEAVDIVCAAQAPNGYLDTYYIIGGMDRIFTNLQDHHELYCLGHLLEGAAAYWQATGKDKLLKAAERYADYVDSRFGPEEGKIHGYPGHEIAEMALARLYELRGGERYLKLARYFIDARGQQPYIFDEQARERAEYEGRAWQQNSDPERYAYYQASKPVREQDEATGHAVRAVYLYSGMADTARLTGDDSLYEACKRIWDNITGKKTYITGGIGSISIGEAFTHAYDLPNDLAYSESCAAIGLAFFARRMLQIAPDRKYGDVMEQALYNTVLAGMALDGKSFFYVNPLESVPEDCRRDPRKAHVKPVRQKWFGCACCPPNIARIVASVGAYAFTAAEDILYTHLYIGSGIDTVLGGQKVKLDLESGFPWDGNVRIRIHTEKESAAFTLAFRIPGWCDAYELSVRNRDGEEAPCGREEKDGYLYLTGDWADLSEIRLAFPMKIRMMQANGNVREDLDKAAFTRGPLTYCMEEADNGSGLWNLQVRADRIQEAKITEGGIGGVPVRFLDLIGERVTRPSGPRLYQEYTAPEKRPAAIRLAPYFAWANRGEGEMRVWIPVSG